jgi:uncharacterized membrane protein YcfT
MAPVASAPDAHPGRVIWIDVARGALILLVVLYHAISVHLLSSEIVESSATRASLEAVIAALRPLRMPLFFLVSGVLASHVLLRPWPIVLKSRTWFFYYLYLVWLLIHTGVLALLNDAPLAERLGLEGIASGTLRGIASDVVAGAIPAPTNLWFLLALAVYFPMAKLLAPLRAVVVLIPAAVVFVLSVEGWPLAGIGQLAAFAAHFFWFVLGARGARHIVRASARIDQRLLAAAVAILVLAQSIELAAGRRLPVLFLVAAVAACYLGVAGSVAVARSAGLRRVLSHLGSRTLPIYVLHMPIIWIWHHLIADVGLAFERPGLALLYSAAVTLVTVAAALVAHRALNALVPNLFRAPFIRVRPEGGWFKTRASAQE